MAVFVQITIVLWILALSVFVFWMFNFFRTLSKGVTKGNLVKILEGVVTKERENTKLLKKIQKEISRIDNENKGHIQKIGLVRFNPFKELGGDHSFSLALLDQNDNGFIITGLHTRERTRVYTKEMVGGKSKLDLSSEEKKALTKAQKGN